MIEWLLNEPEEFARLAHFHVTSGTYYAGLKDWCLPGFLAPSNPYEVCLTIPVRIDSPLIVNGERISYFSHEGYDINHPIPTPEPRWRCWFVHFNNIEMVCGENGGPPRTLT